MRYLFLLATGVWCKAAIAAIEEARYWSDAWKRALERKE